MEATATAVHPPLDDEFDYFQDDEDWKACKSESIVSYVAALGVIALLLTFSMVVNVGTFLFDGTEWLVLRLVEHHHHAGVLPPPQTKRR
mmetsp:Transcript_26396/g.81225  ORF Transcript_26396/g.81225 Transcript_26396/m.81225 type:complete len:89 (-) Transcript_26396:86-352(-)